MLTALGMVFMLVGGLLLLSAVRSYALYRASHRQPTRRTVGEAWLRMLAGMILAGGTLVTLGTLLAF